MTRGGPETMFLAVQSSGIIDHFASVTPEELAQLAGEAGGSVRVELPELERILAAAPPSTTAAGGSAANTLRGLAAGFAVKCGVLGAVGGDEWGQRFRASLEGAGVNTSRLQVDAAKATGRCAVLITPDGQRTMRTALAGAASLQAAAVRGAAASFQGVSWVSVTAFAYYAHGLIDAVVTRTRAAGAKLILHLAAKEVVRAFGKELDELLTSGAVSVLFANEDEAAQYMRGLGLPTDPESAVRHLATLCDTAVVTVGARGCLAMQGDTLVHEPAVGDVRCVDSTGAGDLFAAGFMFAMLNDLALAACVRLGCLSGAAVIMGYGAEVTPEAWAWARSKLPHLALARNVPRTQQPQQHHHHHHAGAPADDCMTQASQTDSC